MLLFVADTFNGVIYFNPNLFTHLSSPFWELANEVTDELVDLMRKVWLPIVGPGYEIIVSISITYVLFQVYFVDC